MTAFPTLPAASLQRVALRWGAGFLLFCLLAQALLIPAQRIKERTHFHVSSGSAGMAPSPSLSAARAVFVHRAVVNEDAHDEAHGEAKPHQHGALQNHDHGLRADVVYLSDHGGASDSRHTQVTKRLVLDQDGLWATLLPTLVIQVARIGHVKSTVLVSTRNELPLERPPRG